MIALIGLISLVALPAVTSYTKISLNSCAREIASTVKETYNSSAMTGHVYRLVYDLKGGKYWVEKGPRTILLDTTSSREREERLKRFSSDKDDKEVTSEFQLDRSITRSKRSLPRGVTFQDVMTEQSDEPITEGMTYTHFFPHGVSEETIIHLQDDSKHRMSLVISALIGKTYVVERYVTKEEVDNE